MKNFFVYLFMSTLVLGSMNCRYVARAAETEKAAIHEALANLYIPEVIKENITLLENNNKGVEFEWSSSNENVISTVAVPCETYYNEVNIPAGVVMRQEKETPVKLTVTARYNDESVSKTFDVIVKAKKAREKYAGYLYAHFNEHAAFYPNDGIQQIFFGTSKNGLDWSATNNNQYVLESNVGDYGVRDPYIIRSPEGDKFYLIATDLDIMSYKYGGNQELIGSWGDMTTVGVGSQNLIIWESDDLVHWSDPWAVNVAADIEAGMAWAPEAIYDEATGEYLAFWSSKAQGSGSNCIYVAKTRDFRTFSSPELYSNSRDPNDGSGSGNIDASIFHEGGNYYRLIKDESNAHIKLQKAEKLLAYGPDVIRDASVRVGRNLNMVNRGALYKRIDNSGYKTVMDKNGNMVEKMCMERYYGAYEGPTMFKFNDREEWCMLLDEYGRTASVAGTGGARGYIPFVTDDLDAENSVTLASDNEFIMPDAAKHGTVISITQTEYDAIMKKWGTPVQPENEERRFDPILAYDFDENEEGTVLDTTGNNHHGTLNGSASIVNDENKGSVLHLDGTNGCNVSFPTGFFDGLDNLSISMDVKGNRAGRNTTVLSMGTTLNNKISSYTLTGERRSNDKTVEEKERYFTDAVRASNRFFNIQVSQNQVLGKITTFKDDNRYLFNTTSDNTLDLKDRWVNVLVTMDDHVMSIYVDGKLEARHEHTRSIGELGSELVAAIGTAYKSNAAFYGDIDNVKVYNRTLSEKDLTVADVQYKTGLQSLISDMKTLDPSKYTSASIEVLNQAMIEAEVVFQKNSSTQAEVDWVYTKLEEAKNQLLFEIVKVNKITLDHTTATIQTNQSLPLTAKVEPVNATNKEVMWTSSDNNVATVDQSGTVTPKELGTVKITATAKDGSLVSGSCTVAVIDTKTEKRDKKTAAKRVRIVIKGLASNQKVTNLYLVKGQKLTIKGSVLPTSAFQKVKYTSKKFTTVSISQKGVITARKVGKTSITATSEDGKKSVTIKVHVVGKATAVSSLKAAKAKITVNVNKTAQINTSVKPVSTTDKVTYQVKNKKVARINAMGIITGKKIGTTTVTVKCGKKLVKIKVLVK